jgi:hypothetical protein
MYYSKEFFIGITVVILFIILLLPIYKYDDKTELDDLNDQILDKTKLDNQVLDKTELDDQILDKLLLTTFTSDDYTNETNIQKARQLALENSHSYYTYLKKLDENSLKYPELIRLVEFWQSTI